MASIETLPPEKQSSVKEFQGITAVESLVECIQHLEQSQWNCQLAIARYFNQDELPQDSSDISNPNNAPFPPVSESSSVLNQQPFAQSERRAHPPTSNSLLNSIFGPSRPAVIHDILDKVTLTPKPIFSNDRFDNTLRQGKEHNRLVCLYLYSPAHDDAERFIEESLCRPEIANFMNKNFLNHSSNVQTPTGYHLECLLRIDRFPCLILGEAQSEVKYKPLRIIKGFIKPDRLLQVFTACNESFKALITSRQIDSRQLDFDRQLRAQQDAAYEKMKKEAAQRNEERKKKEEEEMALLKEQESQVIQQDLEQEFRLSQQQNCIRKLKPEPDKNNKSAINIRIRLPSGEKIERRFLNTCTIEDIQNFIGCQDLKILNDEGEEQWIDEYELFIPMPRNIFTDPKQTLKDAFGRTRGVALVVQETRKQ